MKNYGTREENLSAIGRAYIDVKNNEAIGLMIVLRDPDDTKTFMGEIISFGLNNEEALSLIYTAADVLSEE